MSTSTSLDPAAPASPVAPQADASRGARAARALAEIVHEINQSPEPDRVFTLIARHAAELLDATGSRVSMLEGGELVLVGSFGEPYPTVGAHLAPVDALCAEALRTARPARARLAGDPPDALLPGSEPRNVVAAPLLVGRRAIGAISVIADDSRDFSDPDEQMLLALADHAAVAIENARLLRASVRTLRHASILATSARSLALHVSPKAMYADVWRIAHQSLGADGITIYLADRGARDAELAFVAGLGAEVSEQLVPVFWESFVGRAVLGGFPDFRRDLHEFADRPLVRELLERGVVASAILPLAVEGRPRGVLALRFRNVQSFEPEQRQLLSDFSSHAAVALRNARLFEAERHQREEAEAATAIARVTLEALTSDSAAEELLRVLDEVAPSLAWALAVEDGPEGALRIAASRGPSAPPGGSLYLAGESPRIPGEWDALLPLVARDQSVGVLAVGAAPDGSPARLATVTRLLPSLALAFHTIRMREEERRVAEQMRQSEKLAAVGELVAGVAHEVNNPLAGISAFAQLLQEESLTTEQQEAVQMIKREADRAVAVIRDLLTFARKTGPRSVPIDLHALLAQTLRLRQYGIRTTGIEVVLELAPQIQPLLGDDRQVQQVLLNLIINAEHAMLDAPRRVLRVRTSNDGAWVRLEVSDSGVGMTREVQARIFEPFFTTKGEGNGTGLGLSVSYGIVRSHGGTLTVESALGAGATFCVSLPAAGVDGAPQPDLSIP